MLKKSTFLFFHWNRKSKVDDPVIISSLAFTPETMSSDSLYPTLPCEESCDLTILLASACGKKAKIALKLLTKMPKFLDTVLESGKLTHSAGHLVGASG